MGILKWILITIIVAFLGYNHALREQEKVDVWNYKVQLLTHPHPSHQMYGYYMQDDWRLGSAVHFIAFCAYVNEIRLPSYSPRKFIAIREFCDAYAAGGSPKDENLTPPITWNPLRQFLDIYRPALSPAVFVRFHTNPSSSWYNPFEAREVIMRMGIDVPMVYPEGWLEAGGRRFSAEDRNELTSPYDRYDFDYPFKN